MIKRGKPTKNGQVKITFTIPEGNGHGGVSVVGDFNDWDPYAHPMRRGEDGTYQVSLVVPAHQPIRFRYLADGGVWFDDADADHHDEHGGRLDPISRIDPMALPEAPGQARGQAHRQEARAADPRHTGARVAADPYERLVGRHPDGGLVTAGVPFTGCPGRTPRSPDGAGCQETEVSAAPGRRSPGSPPPVPGPSCGAARSRFTARASIVP